jgi:hypothetical protein
MWMSLAQICGGNLSPEVARTENIKADQGSEGAPCVLATQPHADRFPTRNLLTHL